MTALRLAIVSGETSGDLLGAGLVRALRKLHPDLVVEGVPGPAMLEQGCKPLAAMSELSLMGLAEIVGEIPRLLRLRKRLLDHWAASPPDIFVGVDAPDFNLGLERRMKARGVPTVHYVSPTVWAWRPGRVHTVARAADLVLCLFPFEPDCYRDVALRAEYVGHPFAQECERSAPREAARSSLGIDQSQLCLALLPGSRHSEIERMGPCMAQTAAWLLERRSELQFLIPAADEGLADEIRRLFDAEAPGSATRIYAGRAREVLRAADAAIVTSGTATLETMLLGTPFIVSYRTGWLTAWLMRAVGLLKVDQVAMPNILAGRMLAPELIQEAARPPLLGAAALQLLNCENVREAQRAVFAPVARTLRLPTSERAADAVLSLCAQG